MGVSFGTYLRHCGDVLMGRRYYVLLRRHHGVPIRGRGDVPLRRLGDVPSRRQSSFKWRVTVSGELIFLENYGNCDATNAVTLLL